MKRRHRRHKRLWRVKTRHHLIPKSRGGTNRPENLLTLNWEEHHQYWHKLFGNRTIEEVIEVLQRIVQIKKGGSYG